MISLKQFMEAIDFRVSGGSEYQWKCFGDNARYMDCESEVLNEFSVHAVFDAVDQTVYCVEAWDYSADKVYRWIHPEYIKAYKKACKKANVRFEEACDRLEFTDLEVEEDILAKAAAIASGTEYDTRVQVPLILDKDQMHDLMLLAHEADITLNEYVERLLRQVIEQEELK